MTRKGLTRRGFMRLSMGAALAGVGGHATVLAPYRYVVTQVDVPVARLPQALDGLRVGVMSDIHLNTFMSATHLAAGVRDMNALAPDVMLLAGDYVDGSAQLVRDCVQALEGLQAPLGVYAVLGNHDIRSGVREVLQASAIRLLFNETVSLSHQGARLHVAGLGSVYWSAADPTRALATIPPNPDEPILLLVHEPDYADEMTARFQRGHLDPGYWIPLQISGHTHGGQVRLPGLGALWLPPLGQRYIRGLQPVIHSDRWVFTSVGFGAIFSVRVHCPPELCVLTLRRRPDGAMA